MEKEITVEIPISCHEYEEGFVLSTNDKTEKVLHEAYKGDPDKFPKDRILDIVNELVVPMYLLFQNQYRYTNGKSEEEHKEHIAKYLKVTQKQILLDKEVDKYLAKTTWDNSETYILDTTVYNNNIYCI